MIKRQGVDKKIDKVSHETVYAITNSPVEQADTEWGLTDSRKNWSVES